MYRFQIYAILLMLAQLDPLIADDFLAASRHCHALAGSEQERCYIRPCPCQAGETTLKIIPDSNNGRSSLCACSKLPPQSLFTLRRKAADSCHQHQTQQQESCFVSRGRCPSGFEAIAFYADEHGTGFSSCRDIRHNHAAAEYSTPAQKSRAASDTVLQQYHRLTQMLEQKREGVTRSLPSQSIEQLSRHFRGFPLGTLKFTKSRALAQGCFSDCEQIYCADASTIARWAREKDPIIDRLLIHQIAHAERCHLQGGRDRFVTLWYRYLPSQTQRDLLDGKPIDAGRIHFAMFMEKQAENRAETICHRLDLCAKGRE